MTHPTAYNLITAKTAEDLSAQVNNCLADGWRLYGKPFFGDGNLYQAVILKKGDEKRLRRATEDG